MKSEIPFAPYLVLAQCSFFLDLHLLLYEKFIYKNS